MNKLNIVRESLKNNHDIIIVRDTEKKFLGEKKTNCTYGAYNVNMYTAPKEGLYTVEELQECMMQMIPKNLDPAHISDFKKEGDSLGIDPYLVFGQLIFDEEIGKETRRREITITHEDILKLPEFAGKKTIDSCVAETLIMRTEVTLFPNEKYALDVINGKQGDRAVRFAHLKKYQPDLLAAAYDTIKGGLEAATGKR